MRECADCGALTQECPGGVLSGDVQESRTARASRVQIGSVHALPSVAASEIAVIRPPGHTVIDVKLASQHRDRRVGQLAISSVAKQASVINSRSRQESSSMSSSREKPIASCVPVVLAAFDQLLGSTAIPRVARRAGVPEPGNRPSRPLACACCVWLPLDLVSIELRRVSCALPQRGPVSQAELREATRSPTASSSTSVAGTRRRIAGGAGIGGRWVSGATGRWLRCR